RQGPVTAKGDINGDGQDEIYLGTAKDQLPTMINADFESMPHQKILVDAIAYEDTGASFFDADGDGDLDLYVASGGNEYPSLHPLLSDRLYVNDGKGMFTHDLRALPDIKENTGAIAPADFDGDGDIDLFVGSHVIYRGYGLEPISYILENDGKGCFRKLEAPIIKGMVTTATWADVNEDQRLDLILAGEWMPITYYLNLKEGFKKEQVKASTGWWRTMAQGDFDKDGDLDFILGNHGLNSFLKVQKDKPLQLYVKDFDKNQDTDPLITYFNKDKEYTLATKDELSKQLPSIRKRSPTYEDFSNKSIDEILTPADLEGADKYQAQELASVFLENLGDGSFQMHQLPVEAQLASMRSLVVEDFDRDGNLDILMAGNFYHSQLSIGRLGASYGALLMGHGDGTFSSQEPRISGLALKGEVRSMTLVTSPNGQRVIFAARNNLKPQLFLINGSP
ncbi:MAG: FG-GAP repeat domain-containing protein, partial [Cyclobacteriaceae bacterium]